MWSTSWACAIGRRPPGGPTSPILSTWPGPRPWTCARSGTPRTGHGPGASKPRRRSAGTAASKPESRRPVGRLLHHLPPGRSAGQEAVGCPKVHHLRRAVLRERVQVQIHQVPEEPDLHVVQPVAGRAGPALEPVLLHAVEHQPAAHSLVILGIAGREADLGSRAVGGRLLKAKAGE